ncbi:MAG: hypothetical protein IJ867_08570 [Clostridia bacterium]|nr:hypothetical protein [Clostridia bacterium]
MTVFLLQVIGCVIFVYGILSLVQDVADEVTYKRICHDMKIVVFARNLEKNVEQFMVELFRLKRVNCYKQIVVVDLAEDDDIDRIKTKFCNNEVNVEVVGYEEGKDYVKSLYEREYV